MPLDLRIKVIKTQCNFYVKALGGSTCYMGDVAFIQVDGMDIIIHTARCQNTHPAFFTEFGIDITEKYLVVKSMQHFYEACAPILKEIIYTVSPACLTWNFTQFPYTKLARPVWPLYANPWKSNEERPW